MAQILIDTRIWALAFKNPFFDDKSEIKPISDKAKTFLYTRLQEDYLLLNHQLISEIYHVLVSRGKKIPGEIAKNIVDSILGSKKTKFAETSFEHINESIKLSSETNIHIWDFLVALPVKNLVERIYTMDPHFKNCSALQVAEVINPFNIWKSEG